MGKASEAFDKVFYNPAVWRSQSESMQSYVLRREREMTDLTKISATTASSTDIQAHLLLRFSGLTAAQQASVVSSCGNAYDYEAFKRALRLQYPNIHDSRHQSRPGSP